MFINQLKKLRKKKEMTQKQMADIMEVSLVSYSNWERGLKSPSKENMQKLAQFFEFPLYQLEGCDEIESQLLEQFAQLSQFRKKKVVSFAKKQAVEQAEDFLTFKQSKIYNKVKVYEGLSAGTGFGITGNGSFDQVLTDEELPTYDIAAWIRGDSMGPKFWDWSVALIRETGFDYDGAIYAVYVEKTNTTYIKKVFIEKNGLRLESLNKKYPDRFISLEDQPMIIGKIVGNFVPISEYGGKSWKMRAKKNN